MQITLESGSDTTKIACGQPLSEHARRLPHVTDPEAILAALDPEQRQVATTLEGPVAVIAGAGTGKTRAITHRIAYAAAIGRYEPRAVLAVTFTTRAASEMKVRLQRLGVAGVQARTFHSAALRQAQYFWPQVYGFELPQVAERTLGIIADAASRNHLAVDTALLRDLVAEISWAKVGNVTPSTYPSVAELADRQVGSADPATVAKIFATYEDLKRDRNLIDFDDILLCCAALLTEHHDVAAQVCSTYRHLVVDEYQDVSPLQQTLLNLWRGNSGDVCVVGDPAQTIHTFAGAQARFLTRFARENPGTTVIRLMRDYRSTPQVVATANAIMKGQRDAVVLQAQRPSGPDVVFVEAANELQEAESVASWLHERHVTDKVAYADMAILFRINAMSPALEAALSARGIPYLVRDAERFYERREVRQALHALRSAARLHTSLDEQPIVTAQHVLAGIGWQENPPSGGGAQRERWESLDALMGVLSEIAEELADQVEQPDLAAVVSALEIRAEMQDSPVGQGVTLATLHAAKGLEWEAVALFGIHEGTLPFVLASTPQQIDEERRLLYVGVTRAQRFLHISWSLARSGTRGSRSVSRFLDGVRGATQRLALMSSVEKHKRGTQLAVTCRVCGERVHDAAERKLGRHADCPSSYDEQTLDALREWRRTAAAEQKLPAYCVFTDATLVAIAEARPATTAELLEISGVGPHKIERYGDDVLTILKANVIKL